MPCGMHFTGFQQDPWRDMPRLLLRRQALGHWAIPLFRLPEPCPVDLLEQCSRFLSEQGLLLVVVPYEQPAMLLRADSAPNPHQSGFSRKSLNRLLNICGYRQVHMEVALLSYRVFPMWNILAAATRSRGAATRRPLATLREFHLFFKTLAYHLWARIRFNLT